MSVNVQDLLANRRATGDPGVVNVRPSARAPAGSEPRRFVGTSVREVYARVRAELGPDAMILEQRNSGGRIEVLAGQEGTDTQRHNRDGVIRRLRELGLGHSVLSRLPSSLRTAADVERGLGQLIPCAPPTEPLCGRFRLIGPPGAGKTTALIKLAASRVLRYGRFGTLLIGTDRSRLAGCEQLASSAELLGIEYLECSEQALPSILDKWRHMQLVLVDAPGARGDLQTSVVPDVQDVLTVPAVWQAAAIRRLHRQYQDRPLAGVLVSHTEQAETLWECVNLLVEWQLPVWWIGHHSDLSVELEPAFESTCVRGLTTPFDRSSLASIFAG
jgi:flagellar biosynthesis GTPase FlhF